jgi:hypothetical protein
MKLVRPEEIGGRHDGDRATAPGRGRPNDLLPILECKLDAAGMREQAGRYAAMHATRVERNGQTLAVQLPADVDEALVLEAVEVERACCSFFTIAYDSAARRLTFAVSEPDHAPALDAIAEALSG